MTSPLPPRRIVAVALGLAALLGDGCSTTTRLDTTSIEETLETDYVTIPDVTVGRADCPPEPDVGVGDEFVCTVPVEGQELAVLVTVESSDGEVSLEQVDEVLVTAELDRLVAEELQGGLLGPLEVRCDERAVVVVPADEAVTCNVTDASGSAFEVTVEMGPEGIVEVSRDG